MRERRTRTNENARAAAIAFAFASPPFAHFNFYSLRKASVASLSVLALWARRARLGLERKKPPDPSRTVLTLARRAFDPIDRDRFKPMPTRVSVSKPSRESGRGDSRKLLLARRSNTWKRRLFWISDKISTKKKNIRVTEIPYASTRNTRKKYRTTPAVPKGHRCCVLRRFAAFFPSL